MGVKLDDRIDLTIKGVVGTWKEYREDPDDDYLLTYCTFYKSGIGRLAYEGIAAKYVNRFTWKKTSSNTITLYFPDKTKTILNWDNGVLIEKSKLYGIIRYKKIR